MHILSQHTLLHLVQTNGAWAVGLVTLLEAMGLPLPAESLLIAIGVAVGTSGGTSIALVVLAAATGAVLGDNLGFLIGRTLGLRALRKWGGRVGLTSDRLTLGRYLFRCHGAKVVVFGRFVAILRTFAALLAGANGMEWPRFLVANAIGGIAWAALYGFGAYALGEQVRQIAGPVGIGLAVIAVIAVGLGLFYVRRHEQRLIERANIALAHR